MQRLIGSDQKHIPLIFALAGLLSFNPAKCQETNIDSLLILIRTETNDSLKIRARNRAAYYYIFNRPESALLQIDTGLAEAEKANFKFGIAELLNTKANVFLQTEKTDSAVEYYRRSLDLSVKIQRADIEEMVLNNLGLLNWKIGDFKPALKYFEQSLEIRMQDAEVNEKSLAVSLNNIGLIHQELKQYRRAKKYHLRALKIRENLNLISESAVSKANLGICEKNTGNVQKAVEYFKQAIEHAREAENEFMFYALHENLGSALMAQNKYNEAIEKLEVSISRPAHIGTLPKSDLAALTDLSAAYYNIENKTKALEYARKALAIINKKPRLNFYAGDLYKIYAKLLYGQNQTDSADIYLEKYTAVVDSAFTQNNADALAEWEAKYESAQKDEQIAVQQATLAQKEAAAEKRLLFTVFLSVILLLSLLSILLLINRNSKKAKLFAKEQELRVQESQIHAAITSQESERKRLARDLHDGFGQLISALNLNIASQRKENDPEKRRETAESAQKILDEMYAEIRNTAFNLMPATLIEFGLKEAVSELVRRINQSKIIRVKFDSFDADRRLPELYEISLFRIIQEWINNIIKYAAAAEISVQLTGHEDEITLIVEDDGNGFNTADLENSNGHGWKNIKSRLQQLNGEVTVESSRGKKGTGLIITVPSPRREKNIKPATVKHS